MVRNSVCLFLVMFSYIHAAPVPESAKISVIRNSNFGLALAAGRSKTAGIFDGIRNFNTVREGKELKHCIHDK
ncbi:hypothetical protein HF086_013187 [Spodoptera exigua]|uniref:Uncharacterized protein n=1 Tax=Spodoptera exigua TaxID=7107 RepID=A0A922MBW1_SPOEX|nr:hypothetical protein HF086_013187 [Spodoptera exigua]